MLEQACRICKIPAKAGHHHWGHFNAGFCIAAGRRCLETCRTTSQMMRFWHNSTKSPHSSACPGSQPVSTPQTRIHSVMTTFLTGVLAHWAPELHTYYTNTLNALHTHDHSLKCIFPTSIFAASMYNLGPQTVCFKHTDFANLPFGMCMVTALGDFDPKKGSHLILWECSLIIEFLSGSTILLPSATISHSNVTVDRDEHQYSFMQYMVGGAVLVGGEWVPEIGGVPCVPVPRWDSEAGQKTC